MCNFYFFNGWKQMCKYHLQYYSIQLLPKGYSYIYVVNTHNVKKKKVIYCIRKYKYKLTKLTIYNTL